MKKETLYRIFSKMPELETPRLLLRPMRVKDAEDMFAYAKSPEVTRYLLCYVTKVTYYLSSCQHYFFTIFIYYFLLPPGGTIPSCGIMPSGCSIPPGGVMPPGISIPPGGVMPSGISIPSGGVMPPGMFINPPIVPFP